MNPKTDFADEQASRLGVKPETYRRAQKIVTESRGDAAKLVDLIALELHAAGGPALVPIRNVRQED